MQALWIALAIFNAAALLVCLSRGAWLIDSTGSARIHDFLTLWAAGVRAWGDATLVYNQEIHAQFQSRMSGVQVRFLPFPYPPHFLLLIMPFAALPYLGAFAAFFSFTIGTYAWALRTITRDWLMSVAMALSFGAGFMTLYYGQLGFLTASLLVGGLALMPRKPVAAGILFGLLTVKPHMGLALVIALLLGRQWTVIGIALATSATMLVTATLAFGPDVWVAYLPAATRQYQWMISNEAWIKASTVYAAFYPFLGPKFAMFPHLLSALAALGLMAKIWVSKTSYEARAASLIAATFLVSPYLYPYDAVAMTGAAAFLLRRSRKGLILLSCVLPGLAFVIYAAAVPIAAWLMLYLALRGTSRIRSADERPPNSHILAH